MHPMLFHHFDIAYINVYLYSAAWDSCLSVHGRFAL